VLSSRVPVRSALSVRLRSTAPGKQASRNPPLINNSYPLLTNQGEEEGEDEEQDEEEAAADKPASTQAAGAAAGAGAAAATTERAAGSVGASTSDAAAGSSAPEAGAQPPAAKRPKLSKLGKDPTVRTDFLPDKQREMMEEELRQRLKRVGAGGEWMGRVACCMKSGEQAMLLSHRGCQS